MVLTPMRIAVSWCHQNSCRVSWAYIWPRIWPWICLSISYELILLMLQIADGLDSFNYVRSFQNWQLDFHSSEVMALRDCLGELKSTEKPRTLWSLLLLHGCVAAQVGRRGRDPLHLFWGEHVKTNDSWCFFTKTHQWLSQRWIVFYWFSLEQRSKNLETSK